MAEKEYILTEQGKIELEQELDVLKNVTRTEISQKIEEARSFGDLSENSEYDEAKNEQGIVEAEIAEYDAAKEEQAKVESRINQLEYMLKYAKVVEDDGKDTVTVGKTVTVEYVNPPRGEATYSIVGSSEADPYKNKLSYEAPIGAALIGHVAGDVVNVNVPAGSIELRVISVDR